MGNIKGLQQFISDLRSKSSKEDQRKRINLEIVNVQKQFNSSNGISGYQRKKYILKLIYIYLTSSCNSSLFDVSSTAQSQVEKLLSSKVYSEKSVGYLTISLLNLQQEKDIIARCVQQDLQSHDQESNVLALNYIGNCTDESHLPLVEDVFQILRSATSPPLLKKKSALTMFKLCQLDPTILSNHKPWIPRILALADEPDLGLSLALLPLIDTITHYDLEQVQQLIPTFATKLNLLVCESHKVSKRYIFNGIASPWLIVKLTKLLNKILPNYNIDVHSLRILRECVSTTIHQLGAFSSTHRDAQERITANCVLFAIIALAIQLDPSKEAVKSSFDTIITLLNSRDLNTRYLALNSLISLSSLNNLQSSQKYLPKLFEILQSHQDISIRKKTLELIYALTDSANLEFVTVQLFKVSNSLDTVLKQEAANKISILAERFATDSKWFINTMFRLLSTNGVNFNESIWQRTVQIIINNEELHVYATNVIVKEYIGNKSQAFSETLIKIACIILAEYGYKITATISQDYQFDLLAKLYFYVSNHTRGMLLLSLLKLYKIDIANKRIKTKLIKVLSMEVNSINSELQQRAFEFLNLIQQLGNPQGQLLFDMLLDEMPAFTTGENPLLQRFGAPGQLPKSRNLTQQTLLPHQQQQQPEQKKEIPLTPNWQQGYYRLFEYQQGVFFENSLVKIILRIKPQGQDRSTCLYHFSILNKSSQTSLNLFLMSIVDYQTVDPPLVVNIVEIPNSVIKIGDRGSCTIQVSLRSPFLSSKQIPTLKIQFSSGGGFNGLRLKLPIFLTKFIHPSELALPVWLKHWKTMDVVDEASTIIDMKNVERDWIERFLNKIGFALVDQGSFIFSSGILNTTQEKFGTLVKVKLMEDCFELNVRVTKQGLAPLVSDYIVDFLKNV